MPRWLRIVMLVVLAQSVGDAASAQSRTGCKELAERIAGQGRIHRAFGCQSGHPDWRLGKRQLRRAANRCRRGRRRSLEAIVQSRSRVLEQCLLARVAAGRTPQSDTAQIRNAAGSTPSPAPDSAKQPTFDERIEELLAQSPVPPADGYLAKPSRLGARQFHSGLVWSYAGRLAGMHCTQWHEPKDPHNWDDNYLCTETDVGLQWSHRGPIQGRGLKCIQVAEASDPHGWYDNYFCWPRDLKVNFRFSSTGRVSGYRCVAIVEPSDPHTWRDNYLCHRPLVE